ncbi:MAG TPA: ATP-binding protein [Gaiellaceae bacterium]|jgi:predicted kinase
MRAPVLVVVTGMPSSGKTTVAEAVSRKLSLPLIAKDEIKERLYERLGVGDVAWSGRLGAAAYDLIFQIAETMLAAGMSLIVEANFFRDQQSVFASLSRHRLVQIHCDAPLHVLLDRYASRDRHAGHHDAEKINELPARHASGAHAPLELDGVLVQLDTAGEIDLDELAQLVRAHVSGSAVA